MSKPVFDGNTSSQYGAGLIAKEVHDFYGQSIRTTDTRSIVKNYFTHLRAEYDNDNKPVIINYYRGTTARKTSFNALSASSLGGKYFTVNTAPDNQKYTVWFNLDGAFTQPVVANSKYIEVSVNSGDGPEIVAFALAIVLNLYKTEFSVTRNGSNVEIVNFGLGECDSSNPGTTSFTFTQVNGTQELVSSIVIPYMGQDPIYQGQVLKGYSYDVYSGKFTKNVELNVDNINIDLDASTSSVSIGDADGDRLGINQDGSINVNVVQTSQILKSYFFEVNDVVTGVTETLCTYTASAPVYLQKIEFSGTNIATFELDIDGIVTDKKLTFFNGNLENVFNFDQGLNIETGQIITVKVYHTRPDSGTFNARMQILESGA